VRGGKGGTVMFGHRQHLASLRRCLYRLKYHAIKSKTSVRKVHSFWQI